MIDPELGKDVVLGEEIYTSSGFEAYYHWHVSVTYKEAEDLFKELMVEMGRVLVKAANEIPPTGYATKSQHAFGNAIDIRR